VARRNEASKNGEEANVKNEEGEKEKNRREGFFLQRPKRVGLIGRGKHGGG
jgi:hypothetical protein